MLIVTRGMRYALWCILLETALLCTPIRVLLCSACVKFNQMGSLRKLAISRELLGAALAITLLFTFAQAAPQEQPGTPNEETVASLSAGRVVIAVVKGAILVGTVENPIEADTHPPTPVAIGSAQVGVILGAVRWSSPSSHREIARLDEDLPHLRSHAVTPAPHLDTDPVGREATDLESVGQGLLGRLNEVAQDLHTKVDLPAKEPLAELVLADYAVGYGPEVWHLSYAMKQQEETPGYWTTRVLLPSYAQFWPPEKGQPRTLIEFSYPPENAPPTLLELLRQKDPRLEKLISSDEKMAEVAKLFLQGESSKIPAADATQFLRAALDALAPPDTRETMASISEESGFAWVLEPPHEAALPGMKSARPPDAPSLLHPSQ
jgi:hypothetical protein